MKTKKLTSDWIHFDVYQTAAARGDARILLQNQVSLSVLANSSHWEHIYAIAKSASIPFAVKQVDDRLRAFSFPRGMTYFGNAGDQIQEIVGNYATLRWWMEAEGLVIAEPVVYFGTLVPFDFFAGELVSSRWIQNRLSRADLIGIAQQLDAQSFELKQCLQPSQWKPIAEYNQKFSRNPIRTFQEAASNKKFTRSVRRRLYLARERYTKCIQQSDH